VRGRIEQMLLDGDVAPTDLRPSPATTPYHKKLQMFLSTTKSRGVPKDTRPVLVCVYFYSTTGT
jgi:hypothetical protein